MSKYEIKKLSKDKNKQTLLFSLLIMGKILLYLSSYNKIGVKLLLILKYLWS
jgi:hypothetical protein